MLIHMVGTNMQKRERRADTSEVVVSWDSWVKFTWNLRGGKLIRIANTSRNQWNRPQGNPPEGRSCQAIMPNSVFERILRFVTDLFLQLFVGSGYTHRPSITSTATSTEPPYFHRPCRLDFPA